MQKMQSHGKTQKQVAYIPTTIPNYNNSSLNITLQKTWLQENNTHSKFHKIAHLFHSTSDQVTYSF